MKILFTSVGRRVELIQAFRRASIELEKKTTLIGVDFSEYAPALSFCDESRKICRIQDDNYIPMLLDICNKNKINCLIPTIDTDLMSLAENKKNFASIGTKVLISDLDKVKICRDKNFTAHYFRSLGLSSPQPTNSAVEYEMEVRNGEKSFPAFIKPKDGSSSIDSHRVLDINELEFFSHRIDDYIIQPYVLGREFTIDIFCDFNGKPVYITPRERIAVRAGEVLKTRITQDDVMIAEMQALVRDFRPCGQITVQLIQDNETKQNHYIEINPRFGGGAPISIMAGADSAKATIKMLSGEEMSYINKAAKDGAIYCRYDQSVCVNEKM